MSATNDGGPAFPSPWEPIPEGYFHPDNPVGQTPPRDVYGMSLRDWFAGQALASRGLYGANVREKEVSEECYRIADAMLAERNRRAQ